MLPEDKKESRKLRILATSYILIKRDMYRRIFSGHLAKIVGPSETKYVTRDVHKGNYKNNFGGRALVKKLSRDIIVLGWKK